jgi:superfamily II DNA or RNA helicase
MKFQLREYQLNAVDLLRKEIMNGSKRPILCLPTGAGKTVTFSYLAEMAQNKYRKVGVVCHRKELVEQAKNTMQAYGLNMLSITFGMVQTYVKSPHKIPEMDVCIIDECHIGNFKKFIDILYEKQPFCQIIGATATPISSSKKNPLRNIFTSVVCPVQIPELIESGFLSNITYRKYSINENLLEKNFGGDFTEESQARVFSEKDLRTEIEIISDKTIIFTSSVKQAEKVADICREYGIKTYLVHSKMSEKKRPEIICEYKKHEIDERVVMVNCSILTAGFDDPRINRVIVYRATTSLTLWLQMVGRGSRVINDVKARFVCVDLGGNNNRLGGWEWSRDWPSIFQLQGRNLKDKKAPTKKCVNCDAVIFASQMVCPYCAADQPVKPKEELIGRLEIVPGQTPLPLELRVAFKEMTVKQLLERRKYGSAKTGRPYKMGWVVSQIKERHNAEQLLRELARIKNYKEAWVYMQLNNFQSFKEY